jgi:hypothetical protein
LDAVDARFKCSALHWASCVSYRGTSRVVAGARGQWCLFLDGRHEGATNVFVCAWDPLC